MKKIILLPVLMVLMHFSFAQTNIIFKADFEDGKTGDWQGRGSAVLAAAKGTANTGQFSLLTTNRTQVWNGPAVDLTGKIVFSGVYQISAWVKIKEGQPAAEMVMTAQREKGGNQNWDRIGAVNAGIGSWVNLSGNYEAKNDFDKISVYVESPDAALEYYIDDFTVTAVKDIQKTAAAVQSWKSVPSLSAIYKDHFVVGAAVEPDQLEGAEGELLLKHFSGLSAENVMKPRYMAPAENVFNFDNADKLVNWAVKNNKVVRGHTLLWHQQNAQWMFYDKAGNKVSKNVLFERMEKYITAVVSRYKGKIYAWDVVNEVVERTGLRQSMWFEIAGEEYIEKAFIFARKADPDARLFINEYETTDKDKGETLYNLVKKLIARKIPVDGIGMQFHITVDNPGLQVITDSLKKFSGLGLEIHITELDMSLNADPNFKADKAPEDLLIRQGHRYKEIFNIFKAYKDITNVTLWGFHDGHTWLTYYPVVKADWPLLFDGQLNTKYAYWGLADPARLPEDVVIKSGKKNFKATAPKGTPVIDGKEEKIWEKADVMNISIYMQGSGAHGTGKALYDEKNLYVFVKVEDTNLSLKSSNAFEHDSIEIFVDEKNNKSTDYQEDDALYRINFKNAFSSRGNPARIISAPEETKTGYNIEVMIPLRFIKGTAGTAIGFDLQINDDSGSGIRDSVAKWNDPTNESFRNTAGFGTLVLGK